MNEYKFSVEFLEDAKQFLDELDEKAREKVFYNIWKARITNDSDLFKKLQDEVWEFRTKFSKNVLPAFCFLGQNSQGRYCSNINTWADKKDG